MILLSRGNDQEAEMLCESFRDIVKKNGTVNDKKEIMFFSNVKVQSDFKKNKTKILSPQEKKEFFIKIITESYDFSNEIIQNTKEHLQECTN